MTIQDYTGQGLNALWPVAAPTPPSGGALPATPAAAHPAQEAPRTVGAAVVEAAQQFLRDREQLDPRWRDPLSPASERHQAVVVALSRGIRAAKQGQAQPPWQALREVPTTDEPTLLALYNAAIGWGTLQAEFDQPDVTEIKIIGTKVLIYPAGRQAVQRANPLSLQETEARARIIAADAGMPLNAREPARSLALGYGTRFTAVVGPRTPEPLLVFRRGRTEPWTLGMLVARESLSADASTLIRHLLRLGMSGVVAGATGSGKTAILETLLDCLPDHIITIEDGAQELLLRPEKLWTRQVVDVVTEQDSFRDAMRTVLRQTPRAVAIGECRGAEAGNILSLAMTDHQAWTTIHADDAKGALRRLATLASMPGAEYAGRFEDALHDAVHALPLIVSAQYWGHIGRRVITEVALAVGVERDAVGGLQPVTIPIVQIAVDRETRAVSWDVLARPNDAGDGLTFRAAATTLPAALMQRLRHGAYRAWTHGETGQTPIEQVQDILERARMLLSGGQTERALAETERAWRIRRDGALILPLVHTILDHDPTLRAAALAQSRATQTTLADAVRDREWGIVIDTLTTSWQSAVAVACPPVGGWDAIRSHAERGQAVMQAAETLIAAIPDRLRLGAGRETLLELDRLDRTLLSLRLQRVVMEQRIRVLTTLVAAGEADPTALAVAQAQVAALPAPTTEPPLLTPEELQ